MLDKPISGYCLLYTSPVETENLHKLRVHIFCHVMMYVWTKNKENICVCAQCEKKSYCDVEGNLVFMVVVNDRVKLVRLSPVLTLLSCNGSICVLAFSLSSWRSLIDSCCTCCVKNTKTLLCLFVTCTIHEILSLYYYYYYYCKCYYMLQCTLNYIYMYFYVKFLCFQTHLIILNVLKIIAMFLFTLDHNVLCFVRLSH